MKKSLFIFTSVLVGSLQLAQASDLQKSKLIIGGELAPVTKWSVRISTGGWVCSAEAISANYILTARHCAQDTLAKNIKAYYSSNSKNQPSSVPDYIDKVYIAPIGDVALLHLQTPHHLDEYAQLNTNYNPISNDKGIIMGYGLRTVDGEWTNYLYQANAEVMGIVKGWYGGRYIRINGITGKAYKGDSGGPLLIDNKVVGVTNTVSVITVNGIDVVTGEAFYADLKENAQWITNTISK